MSCSITSTLLHCPHCNKKSNQQNTGPEVLIVVLVLCACLIALQGSGLGSAHIVVAQKQSDTFTELIGITQKYLFINFKLENYSRS